jgi:hypothetical protein
MIKNPLVSAIEKITKNIKLTIAVVGAISTIITVAVSITLKVQAIEQIVADHQKEIDKITQLQADNKQQATQIYYQNKRIISCDSVIKIQNQNISNLFWYKFPYGQWGNTAGNTTNYSYPIQNPK